MTEMGESRRFWRKTAVAVLMLGACLGTANAGPEEDFALGNASYLEGDFVTAMPLLRKAADSGHAQAQAVLGEILDYAEINEEAVEYYKKSAAAGNIDGVFGLAKMLASGEGVKKDVAEARALFIRAAEGKHTQAIRVVAQAYIDGGLEIAEEHRTGKEALKWIKLAADSDFIPALKTLENAYRSGGYGLAVDTGQADVLRKKVDLLLGVNEEADTKKSRRRKRGK